MWDFTLGILGVSIGAIGQFVIEHYRHKRENAVQLSLDTKRKALLVDALQSQPDGKEWRKLTTLSRIIGADPMTTTRLLIELDARGSESQEDVWALKSRKPLRSE